jgi:hypothetical protein
MLALLAFALSTGTVAAREDERTDIVNRAVGALGGKAVLAQVKLLPSSSGKALGAGTILCRW